MSREFSVQRIRYFENKFKKNGEKVLNLTGPNFRLGDLKPFSNKVNRCYASILENCDGPISKEHYISENIIKQLDIIVDGAVPWIKGDISNVAPADLVVGNCLCKYHNGFLSPLDNIAGSIFDNFQKILDPNEPVALVWGPSLSRWFLKVIVGMISSKHISIDSSGSFEVPREWVEILFGVRDFQSGHGLYMTPTIGLKLKFSKRIGYSVLMLDGSVQGIRFNIAGVEFILCLADPSRAFNKDHPSYKLILHPPNGIAVDGRPDRVKIFWE